MPPLCGRQTLVEVQSTAPPTIRQPICVMPATELSSWDVERRDDETVLVRVHSSSRQGVRLPDAVFSFRYGDPQYDYWASQLLDAEPAGVSQPALDQERAEDVRVPEKPRSGQERHAPGALRHSTPRRFPDRTVAGRFWAWD